MQLYSGDMKTQHIKFEILNERLNLFKNNLIQLNFVLDMLVIGRICNTNLGKVHNWLFGPVFFLKSQKPLAVLQVMFSFIWTPMCLRFAKISVPKVMLGFVFASDIWVYDPKITKDDVFCLFLDIQTSGRL